MPALDDDARKKVATLIPSLGRENANEVKATASAIEKALRAAGCDWHDLAKCVTERALGGMSDFMDKVNREPAPPRPASTRFGNGKPMAARTQAEHRARQTLVRGEVWCKEVRALVDEIEGSVASLDILGRGGEFLESLRDKSRSHDLVRISAKQDAWIRRLAREHGVTVPWTEIE